MRQEPQVVHQPPTPVVLDGQVETLSGQALISSTVIIPAYNEEEGIAVVLEKLSKVLDYRYEVIVVDDGSTDATAEVARRFQCKVVSHPTNLGKAAAVRTGIAEALGENIILIDADDTYPCEAIPLITEALDENAIVMGTRTIGRKNIPLLNRIGNGLLCALIRRLYGYQGNDPFTGLYGVKRSVVLRMNLNSSGF
ncbi:MAG: glycosyltransferase family 2 protein, partial [Chloroflexi bacterium]|nr:glycosyltransferase family 2 protein [Chloroflexota bacterium]